MTTFDTYIEQLPDDQKQALQRIRDIVRTHVPDAVESFAYGMPAFKYNKQPLVYMGAFKHHLSLFPTSGPTEVLAEALQAFKVSKGTIQFTVDKPLPEALIIQILDTRLAQIRD